jgi:hypothetical protein
MENQNLLEKNEEMVEEFPGYSETIDAVLLWRDGGLRGHDTTLANNVIEILNILVPACKDNASSDDMIKSVWKISSILR